jgi:hypothetical protein
MDEGIKISKQNESGLFELGCHLDEFYLDLQEDGNHIRLLSPNEIRRSPFPGLRPFRTSEFELFKGRSGQAEELISRLSVNKFLAVIGSSGTGKSSLVRAGVIPQLFGGYLQGTGNRWSIAICRPGADPISSLAVALASLKSKSTKKESIESVFSEIRDTLLKSIYGLLDVAGTLEKYNYPEEKNNLLIIIDQFEELFRCNNKAASLKGHQAHFINLLLKASANKEVPIYVITTMRSEFLGDCVRFRGLPEAINIGQYLVPQLDRSQLKEAIESPLSLCEWTIEPGLTELLINRIEENVLNDNFDQLPILQHVLMRTFSNASLVIDKKEITYDDYKAVGGLEGALPNHAEAKFNELADTENQKEFSKKQLITKLIFQALTDQSRGGQKGGRRLLPLGDLYNLCASIPATATEVDYIINFFRAPDVSFLMPPATALSPELVIDISHESLMRHWKDLDKWINDETANGKLYIRLNERRKQYEADDSDLIKKGVFLNQLKELTNNVNITSAWASRYHALSDEEQGDNEVDQHDILVSKNLEYLRTCIKREIDDEKKEREDLLYKEKQRYKKILLRILTAAVIVCVILTVVALNQMNLANEQSQDATASREKESKLLEKESELRQKTKSLLTQSEIDQKTLKKQGNDLKILADSLKINAFEISSQKKAIEIQTTIDSLRRQPFYHLPNLNGTIKNSMISYVLKEKLSRPGFVNTQQFINNRNLFLLNKGAQAYNTVSIDAISGLRLADTLWRLNSNNIHLKQIISQIFKTNVFNVYSRQFGTELLSINSYGRNGLYVIANDSLYKGSYDRASGQVHFQQASEVRRQILQSSANAYLGESNFLVVDAGSVISWKNGKEQFLGSIPVPRYAVFTSNGQRLITLLQDTVSIWSIDSIRQKSPSKVKPIFSFIKQNVSKMTLSSNNKDLLVQTPTSGEVWDLNTRQKYTTRTIYELGANNYVTFAPTNDNLISCLYNRVNLLDFTGHRVDWANWFSTLDFPSGLEVTKITQIVISKDWRKAIILSKEGAYLIVSDTDSLLHKSNGKKSNSTNIFRQNHDGGLKIKKLNTLGERITNMVFVDQDFAMATGEEGQLTMWNTSDDWSGNLTKSFKRLGELLKPTVDEQLNKGLITYEEALNSQNLQFVKKAAAYFFRTANENNTYIRDEDLNRIKKLYLHGLKLDKGSERFFLLTKVAAVNLLDIEGIPTESLQGYNKKLKLSMENVELYLECLKLKPNDERIQKALASSYGAISFYQIFERNFSTALTYAKMGLHLDSNATWIVTNLALSYLLIGNYEEAEKFYRSYKGLLQRSFLDDFSILEEMGIITGNEPNVLKIKQILRKD